MDFVETKYPHDDTMRDLGIFEDVELVLKNMQLGKFFSHRMESYKELTCEFLASMRYHQFDELDRADVDQGWVLQDQPLIEHKELDGRFQFKFTIHWLALQASPAQPRAHHSSRGENIDFRPPVYTLVGHEDDLREEEPELDRAEDRAESQAEDRVQESADLGEPECYYFEEYEAPRMNPSVVAAHKRIGLLQRFNKWQGKAMEKMQKSMDKMITPHHSKEALPKSLTEPLHFEPREGKTTHREGGRVPRPDAPTRPPDSIESKQRKLNSIELRVELTWRSPCLRTGFEYDPRLTRTSPRPTGPLQPFEQASSTKAKEATPTLKMKKKKRRSRKLDRVREPSRVECS
ncbi:unnamed protein product [Microthlaspi erraticum]|uniref:Arabidopsis retrotransposon Orf1 C-terminal domain-containing protein n=1 Tax=Microthlaspi erraticum TaxID=1685480 RepID=A0A6D2IAM9_9BRAS|nr:unnamed protein product [Microthlaspi erraticum]